MPRGRGRIPWMQSRGIAQVEASNHGINRWIQLGSLSCRGICRKVLGLPKSSQARYARRCKSWHGGKEWPRLLLHSFRPPRRTPSNNQRRRTLPSARSKCRWVLIHNDHLRTPHFTRIDQLASIHSSARLRRCQSSSFPISSRRKLTMACQLWHKSAAMWGSTTFLLTKRTWKIKLEEADRWSQRRLSILTLSQWVQRANGRSGDHLEIKATSRTKSQIQLNRVSWKSMKWKYKT